MRLVAKLEERKKNFQFGFSILEGNESNKPPADLSALEELNDVVETSKAKSKSQKRRDRRKPKPSNPPTTSTPENRAESSTGNTGRTFV